MAIKTIRPNRFETGFTHNRQEEFLMDSADDLTSLPTDSVAGSIAYTADMSSKYKKAPGGHGVK